MKNPLNELNKLLTSKTKEERKVMTVIEVIGVNQVKCELNGNVVTLKGIYAIGDNVIVIGSEIIGVAHKITNEYEV